MPLRPGLIPRALAAVTGCAAAGLLVWANGMMGQAYDLAAARCPHLPDKYVPEIGWMMAMAPAVMALLLALLSLMLAARHPVTAKVLAIAAFFAVVLSGVLAFQMSTGACPPLH